jgi:mannosyltransferase
VLGRRGVAVAIAAPALLAIALTAYRVSTRSLWLDEGATVAIASQHGAALWHAIAHDGGNMLLYYVVLHWLIGAFGDGVAILRLPSVLATGATAALVAAIGLRLFDGDRRPAVSAALLTAVGLPLVFWGQDARGYALMVACAAASFLCVSIVFAAPPDRPLPRRPLVAFAVALLAALYTGFDAILVVPAQLLVALSFRDRRSRALVPALAAVALLCVPLLVLADERGSSQLFWVPSLSLPVLGQALTVITSAGYPPNFHRTALTTVSELVTVALVVTAALAAYGVRPVDWQLRLIGAWIVGPAALALVAALGGEPVELARAGILIIPAVSLILGWGLWRTRLPPPLALVALLVLLGLRLEALAPSYGTSPEPWDAAAHRVLAESSTPSCIAFYPEDGRMPFAYYVRPAERSRLAPVLPAVPWSVTRPYVERYVVPPPSRLSAIVRACPRLWLIASHEGQRRGPPASRSDWRSYQALLASIERHYPARTLWTFGYAAQIRALLLRR